MISSERSVNPEHLTYIIKLEEETEEEVRRIENLKQEYRQRLEQLREKKKDQEKTAKPEN